MILSLTGYGRAELTDETGQLNAELRSVNNRFLQLNVRIPSSYSWAEMQIREFISARISRGSLNFSLEVLNSEEETDIEINLPLLRKLLNLHSELSLQTAKDTSLSFNGLLSIPGIMKIRPKEGDKEALWKRLEKVLQDLIDNFIESRKREGDRLKTALICHADTLAEIVSKVEPLSADYKETAIAKFKERIKELSEAAEIDESRLNTEVALWTDRLDVTEEIVRLKSHLEELKNILDSEEPIGRRLDFLAQELNREANTLSSKIDDVQITKLAIDLKCEIEKIREQAQNIE
ncbi:MAG: YicC family protein [Candidatus Riflebacteria bacterium]|nr:YicC family protein [Candidatus Riflebacteria bacterium]